MVCGGGDGDRVDEVGVGVPDGFVEEDSGAMVAEGLQGMCVVHVVVVEGCCDGRFLMRMLCWRVIGARFYKVCTVYYATAVLLLLDKK